MKKIFKENHLMTTARDALRTQEWTIYRNHGNIGKQTIRHELSYKQIGCILQKYYTITALEGDQYEVLWSRVQQY
jgi:hypothetical protein